MEKSTHNFYDIFISYSQKDGDIAASLASQLDEAGLKCFLADKSILAAEDWDTELRKAILASERILVLLTPRSKDSLWVAAEIGAAWVLGKELISALMFVEHAQLLEPLKKYQTRTIETPKQIQALIREIVGLPARLHRYEFQISTKESRIQEKFTIPTDWERLLKIGTWQFNKDTCEIVGEGMYNF
jgi:hypothetical protein